MGAQQRAQAAPQACRPQRETAVSDTEWYVRRRGKLALFPGYNGPSTRGCGGIGRRARFRSVWGRPRGGSSPLIRIAVSGLTADGTVESSAEREGFDGRVIQPTRRLRWLVSPMGPRWPRSARFAAALVSTVWIVPFLMFLEVTRMVAAVPLAAATTAATTAAMSALFTGTPFSAVVCRTLANRPRL